MELQVRMSRYAPTWSCRPPAGRPLKRCTKRKTGPVSNCLSMGQCLVWGRVSQCPCLINSCHSVCCSKRVGMGWFGRCFFFACLGPCFTGKARCGCTGGWTGLCLRKPLLLSEKKDNYYYSTINGHEPLSKQLRCFNSLIKQAAGPFSCFSHQHKS